VLVNQVVALKVGHSARHCAMLC